MEEKSGNIAGYTHGLIQFDRVDQYNHSSAAERLCSVSQPPTVKLMEQIGFAI